MKKQINEFELNKRSDRIFYIWVIVFFILFSPAFYMMMVNDLGVPSNVSIERAINSLGKLNDFDTLVEYNVNEAPIK